jgi:hypothetical protein
MGRTKSEESAICKICNKDFESGGPLRYRNLKRHILEVHKMDPQVVLHQNFYSNCFVNNGTVENNIILTNVGESDIKKLLDEDTMKIIRERAGTIDDSLPKLALVIFKRFHCNPKYPEDCNIVIPNLNNNEIWAKTPSGTKIMTREAGVQLALDTLYKPGGDLNQVVDLVDETKLRKHLSIEKMFREEDDDDAFVENLLKTADYELRAKIVRVMKKQF